MTKRNSFVLYYATADDLIDLTDEECGKLFRALFAYVIEGEVPSLSPMCMMAFRHIRRYIDANEEKYRQKCEKNSAAGKISAQIRRDAAAKRAAKTPANESHENEQTYSNVNTPEQAQTPSNLYEYDHESVSESEFDSESDFAHGSEHEFDSDAVFDPDPAPDLATVPVSADSKENVPPPTLEQEPITETVFQPFPEPIPEPIDDRSRADQRAEQNNFSESREDRDETVIPYERPTQAQVRDYCLKHGLSTDPNRFFRINYFNDWKVDGKPIRDWRAMLRGWAKYDGDAKDSGAGYNRREFDAGRGMIPTRDDYSETVKRILENPPSFEKYQEIWNG